ncbi:hypothetical protein T492DRAFT_1091397 [Pavlovales sp. CCMP2436]|nr:hypothetical protein T492DRAFT_1091397 [Pavlovales sp. CCMP2436]
MSAILMAMLSGASRVDCVLSPTYAPHYDSFARMLESIAQHASDADAVKVFNVVDDEAAVAAFEARHAKWACAAHGKCFATPLTMERLLPAFGSTPAAMDAELARAVREGRFWERKRQHQALKKLYGVRGVRAQCYRVWVLDSESLALRNFSFASIFDDWFAKPAGLRRKSHPAPTRNLFSDSRDALCSKVIARSQNLTAAAVAALGVVDAARGEFHHLHFRTNDYWFVNADAVEAMVKLVELTHRRPFMSVFVENAAGLAVYYGVFAHAYLSPASNATRLANATAAAFLADLSAAAPLPTFAPQRFCSLVANANASLSSTTRAELATFTASGCKFDLDLEVPLLVGVGLHVEHVFRRPKHPACSLSVGLRRELLRGAFSWLHGYRFNRIRNSRHGVEVAKLFATSPHITWATSNWNDQFRLPD